MSALDDEGLLALAGHGDADAYGELFERHRGMAVRVGMRYLPREEAEDVAQEVFMGSWALVRRGAGPVSSFPAYVATGVRHGASRRLRERARARPTESLPERAAEGPDVEAGLDALAAASGLIPEWRQALWATAIEGMTSAELGERLGISANAASALASRARRGLRRELGRGTM